jgi:hypothetical protein
VAGQTVADLIEALPVEDAAEVFPAVDRLYSLEDEIDDEFLGLAWVRFVPGGKGQLIVTDTRLIIMGNAGRLTTIDYSEIDSIEIGPGSKKLLGGYEQSHLMIHRHQGDMINLILPGERDWAMGTMMAARRAHEQHRLKGPPTRPRSGAARTEYGDTPGGGTVTLSPDNVRELDLLLTTLSVYAEARNNDDMVRRVDAFVAEVLRPGRSA